jgi:hypothetical protein
MPNRTTGAGVLGAGAACFAFAVMMMFLESKRDPHGVPGFTDYGSFGCGLGKPILHVTADAVRQTKSCIVMILQP